MNAWRTRTSGARYPFLRPYRRAAVLLLALGALCLLAQLQSPSMVCWTGERVVGTDDGGIIFYTVDGDERTLNDPHEAPLRPEPVRVCADPADSSHDRVAGLGQAFDAVFVLSPFAAAGVVVVVGLVRRRRFLARRAARDAEPTWGTTTAASAGAPRPSRSSPSRRSSR